MTAKTASPRYQAMLTVAGFADIEMLYTAAIELAGDPLQSRIHNQLVSAFADLEYAERAIGQSLDRMASHIADQQARLAGLSSLDTMWISATTERLVEANVRLAVATDQINSLVFLCDGVVNR